MIVVCVVVFEEKTMEREGELYYCKNMYRRR